MRHMSKTNLDNAKRAKNDEFYTRIEDIKNELQHYTNHLKGKRIYLNADHPDKSNFWRYLDERFDELGLESITATYYERDDTQTAYVTRRDAIGTTRTPLKGNGDFRSDECVDILKASDILITNPPFSLFRALIDLLIEHDTDFVIMGNQNAMTYKNVFPHMKEGRVKLGVNKRIKRFNVPAGYNSDDVKTDENGVRYKQFGNIGWFTTLNHGMTPPPLELTATYYGNESDYPRYDNYDAINVDRVKDIPRDYAGIMGVPITYLIKHNPEQFEISGLSEKSGRGLSFGIIIDPNSKMIHASVNGKRKFTRLFIRRP